MGFLRYRGARRCRGWMAFFPKDLERPCLISWWNDEWGDNISSPRAPEIPEIRNSKPSRRCFTKTIPDVSVWPHSLIQHICVAIHFQEIHIWDENPQRLSDFSLLFSASFSRHPGPVWNGRLGTWAEEWQRPQGPTGSLFGFLFFHTPKMTSTAPKWSQICINMCKFSTKAGFLEVFNINYSMGKGWFVSWRFLPEQ